MTFVPRSAALVLALAVPHAVNAEPVVQVGVGADYSSGDYGAEDKTEQLSVPVSVQVQSGRAWVRASVPYLNVSGPTGVVVGGGNGSVGGATGGVVGGGGLIGGLLGSDTGSTPSSAETYEIVNYSRSGIGDVDLSAGYSVPLGRRSWLGAAGAVKLPTASEEKFLGTGTTDYTAAAELGHDFGGFTLSANGGRRFNGRNERYALRDTWQAGGAVRARASDNLTLGLGYSWREAALAGFAERSEASASASYRLNGGLTLQGYGYTGFTESSPDIGGGVQLLYRLGG
ncbi:transporter [Croceicoccus bisphenolivorans]|uniref:transporter n=1 Tax=Croceicoccus bisphenolivorans TaxID=1783232 RepID=UPI00082A061D|nr:transporter [Croceicoccus bisphenolivorans]